MLNYKSSTVKGRIAILVAGAFFINIAVPALAQTGTPTTPVIADSATDASKTGVQGTSNTRDVFKTDSHAEYLGSRMGMLIFPFNATDVEKDSNVLGVMVAKTIKDGLARSTQFEGLAFNERHPAIKRARDVDSSLKETDLKGPFGIEPDEIQKALKIANVMETPRLLVGVIENLQIDRERHQASVSVSAEVIDTASGRIEKTYEASGKSPDTMTAGTDQQYAAAAVDAATVSLINLLVPQVVSSNPGTGESLTNPSTGKNDTSSGTSEVNKKKKKSRGLLAGIAILAAVLIFGGGGGGGSSSGGVVDNPPPPPF